MPKSLKGEISLLVRMYECVKDLGLFLFNDVVVLTEKIETHVPFSLAVNTSHTFLASVSLHSLSVSDIVDTKCEYCIVYIMEPDTVSVCMLIVDVFFYS